MARGGWGSCSPPVQVQAQASVTPHLVGNIRHATAHWLESAPAQQVDAQRHRRRVTTAAGITGRHIIFVSLPECRATVFSHRHCHAQLKRWRWRKEEACRRAVMV